MDSCEIKDPLTLAECRGRIMEAQSSCLEKVVANHNDQNVDSQSQSIAQVQEALSSLSTTQDQGISTAMQIMTDAARKAFARLVLTSECIRTGSASLTVKLNNNQATRDEPLKTSRMTRSEILEFCALCQATVRIESVKNHLRDPQNRLLHSLANNDTQSAPASTLVPPIQRVENLQRLLLQAMGYDADMGLTELARQVKVGDGNDDLELVQLIQQTTQILMQALHNNNHNTEDGFLSDQKEGGFTRVLSVQHSEKVVSVADADETVSSGAPVSQSMRDDNTASAQLQMAQKAAALRDSLVKELVSMTEDDRNVLLQQAEQALQDFQQKAMEIPVGPERIEFLRNMDDRTQKLLAMHRIWQEYQK